MLPTTVRRFERRQPLPPNKYLSKIPGTFGQALITLPAGGLTASVAELSR